MQILGSVSDNSVMVWDAWSGEQRARLVGHLGNVHVLEGHPSLHHIAMSASYDGQIIIWDLYSGSRLKR